jgi:hypothetical protein
MCVEMVYSYSRYKWVFAILLVERRESLVTGIQLASNLGLKTIAITYKEEKKWSNYETGIKAILIANF